MSRVQRQSGADLIPDIQAPGPRAPCAADGAELGKLDCSNQDLDAGSNALGIVALPTICACS